jgi:RAB protein geranylgeranyltransferase component A
MFARLAAVHGVTYMLKPDLEVIYNEDGTFRVKDAVRALPQRRRRG